MLGGYPGFVGGAMVGLAWEGYQYYFNDAPHSPMQAATNVALMAVTGGFAGAGAAGGLIATASFYNYFIISQAAVAGGVAAGCLGRLVEWFW